MKKYLSGLITGILISLSITVFAAEFNIISNPFPVIINGTETEVEGYNINGSTYLKLKDFEKAGLQVNFENNTILISTIEPITTKSIESKEATTLESDNTEVDNMTVTNKDSNPITTTYDGFEAIEQDEVIYVAVNYLGRYNYKYNHDTETASFEKDGKTLSFNKNDTNYCINYQNRVYIKLSIIQDFLH